MVQPLSSILKDLIALIITFLLHLLCCLCTVPFSLYLHKNRKLNFCLFSFVSFSSPPQLFREVIMTFVSTSHVLQGNQENSFDKLDYRLSARKQSGNNIFNSFSMNGSVRCSQHTAITHRWEEFYLYGLNKAKSPMKVTHFLSSHTKLNCKFFFF